MAKMKKSVTGTSPIWQVCTYAVLLLVVLDFHFRHVY